MGETPDAARSLRAHTEASDRYHLKLTKLTISVLDAPGLRDDYYCSLLAYSPTVKCLAVGLGPHVLLWSESRSLPDRFPGPASGLFTAYVTSVAFSSVEGTNAILAVGRSDGSLTLWSPLDEGPRFNCEQPSPISCVAFRPVTTRRRSVQNANMTVATEELLVGDERGDLYYYAVEWPGPEHRDLFGWHGSMTLLARVACHSEQVCGIAWSADGKYFATGGNDNRLCIFESRTILAKRPPRSNGQTSGSGGLSGNGVTARDPVRVPGQENALECGAHERKQAFTLNAAVKAMAFAPWQTSLVAAGGGSNDRCVHFFHIHSGARLATIDCQAQVTGLLWSENRREIAVTLGFAQPEHPYRVAVFAWPSCDLLVSIPWYDEERALYAVLYPHGSRSTGSSCSATRGTLPSATIQEQTGIRETSLIVATSDARIKFHDIWPQSAETGKCEKKKSKRAPACSQILEDVCSEALEATAEIR